MTKKVPVLLGKGFVGSNLSNYFTKNNLDHFVYNRAMLDYTDKDTFSKFLEENKERVSYIINCFGYTGRPNVDGCESNKKDCWLWNVLYPLNILDIANELKIPVVHIGSGCVYTGYEKVFTEDDEPNFGLFSSDSSFYSKCKHEFEILAEDHCVYILRIRIPFSGDNVAKNYFTKLLKYDQLIDNVNSVTSLNDFCNFMFRFHFLLPDLNGGIYNVVNPEPIKTEQTVELLRKYNLNNPNWSFIKDTELKTIAKRSNCVLSTQKIESKNLGLPPTLSSLERDIKLFAINNEMV
jgi:dTDP-4-dehydrorhamnose reductase